MSLYSITKVPRIIAACSGKEQRKSHVPFAGVLQFPVCSAVNSIVSDSPPPGDLVYVITSFSFPYRYTIIVLGIDGFI